MRSNLEDVRGHNFRFRSGSLSLVEQTLTGAYNIGAQSLLGYIMDAGGVNRNVTLPSVATLGDGRLYLVGNKGATGNLVVLDSLGATVTTVVPGSLTLLFSTKSSWVVLMGQSATLTNLFNDPVIVTASPATIDATTTKVVVQRSGPAATTLNLPTVVGRVQPLIIADLSTNLTASDHVITLDGSGGELIMGAATYTLTSPAGLTGNVGSAAITLWPVPAANQWIAS